MRIPLPLQLAIPFDRGRMRLPVGSLIIGVGIPPLAPAVTDDLSVFRVGRNSVVMVFGTAAPSALRLAADALVQTELRRFERLLAKTAGTERQTAFLRIDSEPIP